MPANFTEKSREELLVELQRLSEENGQLRSQFAKNASERELAQNKFRMLFEHSPIGMALVLHETGEFLEVNNSILKSTGYTREEFLSLSYWDVTPKEYEQQEIVQLQTLNDTGRFGPNFKEYIRKDGSRYPLSISGALFEDVDGRKVVWGIIEDLSDRREKELIIKKQNEELLQVNAAKDKFFSIIAHDLKSPFSAIIGFSDLLSIRVLHKDLEGIDKYAKVINQSAKKAMDLLLNLMEWSQIQTGRMNYAPAVFDLKILSDDTISLLEAFAAHKNILITNRIAIDSFVYADKLMVGTVLRNLISNALKYTHAGGQVTLDASNVAGEMVITISDNGIGVNKQLADNLFKIEGVYSRPGTSQEKGTGLGLVLCKEFVERNKGRIWIESEEDKGSSFFFTLPFP